MKTVIVNPFDGNVSIESYYPYFYTDRSGQYMYTDRTSEHESDADSEYDEFYNYLMNEYPIFSNYINSKESKSHSKSPSSCDVNKVIFNPPATIVYWKDKSKTVVIDKTIGNDVTVSDDEKTLSYKYKNKRGETKTKHIDYLDWKEYGLINAFLKHLDPGYLNKIDKILRTK